MLLDVSGSRFWFIWFYANAIGSTRQRVSGGRCLAQEVEQFDCLGVFFASEGKIECEVAGWIAVASAVMWSR